MKKVRNAEIIIENNDNKASGNIYKEFIVLMKDIIEDIKVGKVKSTYDKVYTEDEYERYIAEKGINVASNSLTCN
ncbi:MAG: hypothetical protein HFE51_10705 [Clostridia bacterium]|nr:hypothetical protein [Clostridia bacterium]